MLMEKIEMAADGFPAMGMGLVGLLMPSAMDTLQLGTGLRRLPAETEEASPDRAKHAFGFVVTGNPDGVFAMRSRGTGHQLLRLALLIRSAWRLCWSMSVMVSSIT